MPSRARRRSLTERLGGWYRDHRRDLPWRRVRDPYAIWISEAMLQQTRVETVVDYWHRFLERFPDVESLAGAPIEEVLAQWSGLGYYRRARSLHAAAGEIAASHGGRMPRTKEELLALPGIGPYTAGALLSIAFGLPEPLVDGNVERVFARLFALEAAADDPAFRRHCWKLAERLVEDHDAPGEWNQALMELGATLCTPRRPDCPACPLRRSCAARKEGRVEALPLPKRRGASVPVALEILLVAEGDRYLLQRRPPGGRMAGLFEFPTREVPAEGRGTLTGLFPPDWPRSARGAVLVRAGAGGATPETLTHAITRHRIRARLVPGSRRPGVGLDERFAWASLGGKSDLALTGMARKVWRRIAADGGKLAAPE